MAAADSGQLSYEPAIDGLRGLAVLSVVLFHSGFSFPGGFVGVDVFFVISGYLLTSIIINEVRQDRFTYLQFWERRARRILPPAIVMNVAVLIAGWFLLLPDDFLAVGRSVIAQALFVANVYFWRSTGYFAGPAEEMPLLHTWSLAVEEQFYFLLPILLLMACKLRRTRWINPVTIGLWMVFVVSFAASLHGMIHRPSTTFYLLPTRAWELVCGSLVAVTPTGRWHERRVLREFMALSGVAAILAPCFFYSRQTLFPGAAALPPCLGTAAILWSLSRGRESTGTSFVSRVLSSKALVGVGLISYSLYLWHWPLFAFAKLLNTQMEISWELNFGLIAASFLMAWISWRIVETPFRKKRVCASRRALFSFALVSGACLVLVGLVVNFNQGFTGRFSPKAVAYADGANHMMPSFRTGLDDVLHERLRPLGDLDSDHPPTVLVWGDSHALSASAAFDELLKEQHLVGRLATHEHTPPVLDWYFFSPVWGVSQRSPQYNEAILDYAVKHQFRHAVLIASWKAYLTQLPGLDSRGQPLDERHPAINPFEAGLLSLIQKLRQADITPWLLLTVPTHSMHVPKALARFEMFGRDVSLVGRSAVDDPSPYDVPFDLEKVRAIGCRVLDPIPEFFNSATQRYDVVRDDVVLYWDANHLTKPGALKILLPFLRREFRPN